MVQLVANDEKSKSRYMPQLPDPASEEISLVLVGSWNPAIFHPEWFVRQGLVSRGEADRAETAIISPQVASVRFLDFGLQILANRLSVQTTDVSKAPRIHDLVIGILTKLPHTPIGAGGINQFLHLPTGAEANWHRVGNQLAPKELVWRNLYEQRPGLTNISIQFPSESRFPGFVNISVQPSTLTPHGILVASNTEFRTTDQVGSAPQFVDFIQAEWSKAIKEARRVAEEIFKKILW
jgi:hypothetical protein